MIPNLLKPTSPRLRIDLQFQTTVKIVLWWLIAASILFGCNFPGSASQPPGEAEALQPILTVAVTPSPTPIRSDQLPNFATPITPDQTDSTTATHIVLWHGLTGGEFLTLYEITSAFQEQYPDLQISLRYFPYDDLFSAFAAAPVQSNKVQLLLGPHQWGPELFSTGTSADISSYPPPELLAHLNAPALKNLEYQNALVGLPVSLRGIVMWRNQVLFPTAPLTLEQMRSMVQNETPSTTVGTYLDRGLIYAQPHLGACQGSLMTAIGNPAFNSPAGLCWLDLLHSFSEMGPTTVNTDDDLAQFMAGRVGFIFEDIRLLPQIVTALGTDSVIDPWPRVGNQQLSGYVGSQSIYLQSNLSLTGEAAGWKLMDFFLSPQAQMILTAANQIPARTDLTISEPLIFQAVTALAAGTPAPHQFEIDLYWPFLQVALDNALYHQADPSLVLQTAHDEITAEIHRINLEKDESLE